MEIVLIAVVAVAIGALIYFNRSSKSLDVNKDGQIDYADAALAARNAVEGVKATAADVTVAVTKTKTGAKKAATKAKETVKKAAGRGRKPKAK
jgi:hypothetical protein